MEAARSPMFVACRSRGSRHRSWDLQACSNRPVHKALAEFSAAQHKGPKTLNMEP